MQIIKFEQRRTDNNFEVIQPPHDIIKNQRLSFNLDQEQIADMCDISTEQYKRYESGERSIYSASFQVGVKLCYYLQIDLNDLFSFEEP